MSFFRLCAIIFTLALFAGCTNPAESLYPLTPGHWRYYRSQIQILDETRVQRVMIGVVDQTKVADKDAAVVRRVPYYDSFVAHTDDGIVRLARRDRYKNLITWEAAPAILLPNNIEPGTSWTMQSKLALIESRTFARQDRLRNRTIPFELDMTVVSLQDSVELPAGRFEDCVLITGSGKATVRTDRGNAVAEVNIEQRDWYAHGIGLIKSERHETSDSPFLKPGSYALELLESGH